MTIACVLRCLRKRPKVTSQMDPGLLNADCGDFATNKEDFEECHHDAEEMMPHCLLSSEGKTVVITACVDESF